MHSGLSGAAAPHAHPRSPSTPTRHTLSPRPPSSDLYVDGNTKHARAFNCVQRSHQQAFETLPQFLFFTAAASILHPLTAAANVTMWLIGRMTWSSGYATSEGDPSKRYDHPLAFLIFSSVIAQFLVSVITGGEILGRGLFF